MRASRPLSSFPFSALLLLPMLSVSGCGDDSSVSPTEVTGACCTVVACYVVEESGCTGTETFLGPDTVCEPDPCPAPGSCCVGSRCVVVRERECVAQDGEFLGEDTICGIPEPGPPVALGQRSTAAAGSTNRDGVLLLHVTDLIHTTSPPEALGLDDCEDFVTQSPGTDGPMMIVAAAAFPDWSRPRVSGIEFGIDSDTFVDDWGHYLGFALPTFDWPGPGSGIALTVGSGAPLTNSIIPLCWFAAYAYEGATFELTAHPQSGTTSFADDSVPAIVRDAIGLGRIGFGTATGRRPCAICD